MEYTLAHFGVPIAVTEASDARGLIATLARPLPAFAAVRARVPAWLGVTIAGAAGFSDGLEWRDGLGALVPAAQVDVWRADPAHVLVLTQFAEAPAAVGARLTRGPAAGAASVDG